MVPLTLKACLETEASSVFSHRTMEQQSPLMLLLAIAMIRTGVQRGGKGSRTHPSDELAFFYLLLTTWGRNWSITHCTVLHSTGNC